MRSTMPTVSVFALGTIDGTRAYVSFASDVAVIDVTTRELVGRVEVEAAPHEISLEDYYVALPDGTRVTPEHGAPAASPGAEPAPDRARPGQQSKAAGITLAATVASSERVAGGSYEMSFAVVMDTHVGDLMEHDVDGRVAVRADGSAVDARVRWRPEEESSHHRRGTLEVTLPAPLARSVVLVFEGLGVSERWLRFPVESPSRRPAR